VIPAETAYQVVAMLMLATLAITVYGLLLTRPLLAVMRVPRERLMPVVYVLCVVGAFAITQRMFDVYVMLAFGLTPMWTWLLFPLILFALLVFVCALAMLLSALNVRFRDVAIIWTVLATALNYGTPIIYPLSIVPETLKHILMANPLTPIFQQAHVWMIDPGAESVGFAAGGPLPLVIAGLIYVGVCIASVWVFRREAPRIAEQL